MISDSLHCSALPFSYLLSLPYLFWDKGSNGRLYIKNLKRLIFYPKIKSNRVVVISIGYGICFQTVGSDLLVGYEIISVSPDQRFKNNEQNVKKKIQKISVYHNNFVQLLFSYLHTERHTVYVLSHVIKCISFCGSWSSILEAICFMLYIGKISPLFSLSPHPSLFPDYFHEPQQSSVLRAIHCSEKSLLLNPISCT